MVDDDGSSETIRHDPTIRGVAPRDISNAATAVAEVEPTTRKEPALQELAQRYTLGAMIGEGGMGEVVLATDEQIGREVAVKRIRSSDPSAETVARFVREARVQGRLEHPAIVPVHDLAIDRDGRPFFVMKRLTGEPMSSLLADIRAGRVDDDVATRRRLLNAFADVCLAVEFAHKAGVIHRDLKPANVMLGDFGEVYVIDWGIARAITDDEVARPATGDLSLGTGETKAGTILGTPAYMAPEQLAGERAGIAADIYALGCILFEIVAGEPLHKNQRSLATSAANLRARRPDAPPELDAICDKATALDPNGRYASARALHVAVQAYLDGDRDVAMRKELALEHVAEANAALADRSEDGRRRAIRAAGRALALDPTLTAAADIIGGLMLAPPEHMPAEVDDKVLQLDITNGRVLGRIAGASMLAYLMFVPILIWSGITNGPFIAAMEVLALASGAQILWLTQRDRIPVRGIYVSAALNALVIALICRMVGPFVIAPMLAATTLMGYAAHPRFGHIGAVGAILGSGVAVPWFLELVGVLDRTYAFHDGKLELSSNVLRLSEAPVQVAFAVLLVVGLTTSALFSRTLAIRQREASLQLELQAWHLRQIVPTQGGAR